MGNGTRTWRRRARGSVYLLVLAASLLVGVIGVAGVLAAAAAARTHEDQAASVQARLLAQGAVDLGLYTLATDANWRTSLSHGYWVTDRPAAGGRFSLQGLDPLDGSLADSAFEGVTLIGTGVYRNARQMVQVQAAPVIQPLDALRCALHAYGNIVVNAGKTVTVIGGPMSSNGALTNSGAIVGNVEAASITGWAGVSGTVTVPAAAKAAVPSTVFAYFRDLATPLGMAGNMDKKLLGPGYNPWGATNASGLYYMDATGKSITIKASRILGTLVIECSGKTVTIDTEVLMEPARADYPTLIVNGNVVMKHTSATTLLSEARSGVNFNPAAVPYRGSSDSFANDVYPNEIRGLVHVTGTLQIDEASRVVGAVVCEGAATINGNATLVNDASLPGNLVGQYRQAGPMRVVQDSWAQKVD